MTGKIGARKPRELLASNLDPIGPSRSIPASVAATAAVKRALIQLIPRPHIKTGGFQNTYFLRGLAGAQGPGSSNKRFRSWRRFSRTI